MKVKNYTALLSGYTWVTSESDGPIAANQPTFITYSFPSQIPDHIRDQYPSAASSWTSFSAADQKLARAALKQWGDNSGIVFLEVGGDRGDIIFDWMAFNKISGQKGYAGFGGLPLGWDDTGGQGLSLFVSSAGDISMNLSIRKTSLESAESRTEVLLHEIGHALGLKHPFEADGSGTAVLTKKLDNISKTIMSYTYPDGVTDATKLGPLDIAAIRAIYGGPTADGSHVAHWSWSAPTETLTHIGKPTADKIIGTSVTDVIQGMEGSDSLSGLRGNDTLSGGEGDDTIYGGEGDDLLTGGPGLDHLQGGYGADRFIFTSVLESVAGLNRDVITHFDAEQGDLIDLSGVDASSLVEGDQAFAWTDAAEMYAEFTGLAGQLRYDDNILQGDTNGDGIADFEIQIVEYSTFLGRSDIIV